MDPLTSSLVFGAGTSLIGSLFGNKKSNAGQFRDSGQAALTDAGSLRPRFDDFAQQGEDSFDLFAPQARQATQEYGDFLENDPWTDQQRNRDFDQRMTGVTSAYTGAKANLAAEMARRGLSGSSVDTGGMEGIETGLAGAKSGAYGGVYDDIQADRERRLQQRVGLFSGAAGNAQGAASSALGQQGALDQFLAQIYFGQAGAEQGRADAADNGLMDLLGGVSSAAGSYFGSKAGKK